MAEAHGNTVQHWRAYVKAYIASQTDTTATIKCETYWQSLGWGYETRGNGSATVNGQGSGAQSFVARSGSGASVTTLVASKTLTVNKGASGYNVWCSGSVSLTGGYHNGTSSAGCNVYVGQRAYYKPRPPKAFAASRVSDTSQKLTWQGDYTGMDGGYPWASVHIDRRTDGGGWVTIANLNWDAVNYTDNSTTANHRYEYRAFAKGAGGTSDYTAVQTVYTTPAAPSGCSAARRSDSQASVTWSRGANATVTYSNVLLERRTDDGGWAQIATLGAATTNYTDNGIAANHRYDYRVRAYNGLYSAYSTQQGYIYTTPAAPRSVSVSKVGGTRVRISVESGSRWAEEFLYQVEVNGGGWSAEKPMGSSIEVDAGGGTVRARARARRGSLYSAYTASGSVTTIVAPNAPTIGKLASVYAIPATVRLEWALSHPDGTDQTAAQVEVTDPSGAVTVNDVQGPATRFDLSLTAEGEHRVRVRTKGLDPSWGAWSASSVAFAENAPQAFFTFPASDGFVVEVVPFTVEWTVETSSGVSSQEVRLVSESGEVLHAEAVPATQRSYTFGVGTYLPQTLKGYTVSVAVSDGYSLSADAARRVQTDYAQPAIPYISIENDEADMSAHVTVWQGEGGWTLDSEGILHSPEFWDGSTDRVPVRAGFESTTESGLMGIGTVVPTVRLSVARLLEDGSQEMIAESLPSGHETIDRLPPLNVPYTYLVTAYSESGTATTDEVRAVVDSMGAEAYNFGPDASASVLLGFDARGDSSVEHGGEWFNFALGDSTPPLPAFYPDGTIGASGSHQYTVASDDTYRRLDALRRGRGNAVCWFRDYFGGRYRVKADWSLGYDATTYSLYSASASLTEVVWEEPVNG